MLYQLLLRITCSVQYRRLFISSNYSLICTTLLTEIINKVSLRKVYSRAVLTFLFVSQFIQAPDWRSGGRVQ